jgi:transaldolase
MSKEIQGKKKNTNSLVGEIRMLSIDEAKEIIDKTTNPAILQKRYKVQDEVHSILREHFSSLSSSQTILPKSDSIS